jgi:MFS family permease
MISSTPRSWPFGALGVDRSLGLLLVAILVNVLGYFVFVPILPLYLHQLGASPQVIGLVTGIGLLCFGLGQYPAGWLADRFDRRLIAILATVAYGVFFLVYLLPLTLQIAIPIRLLNAFVGGFFTPAALALAADLAPPGNVSRAYGMWQSTTMAGFLVGPLFGGVGAGFGLNVVFVLAGALCILAALPLLALKTPRRRISDGSTTATPAPPIASLSQIRRLIPAIVSGAGPEYLAGLFTAIWSIFLLSRGGAPWQIGLTFTLFALPSVLFSVWLGGVVDRRGARLVMAIVLVATAAVSPLYSLVASVALLMLFATAHGVTSAAERPVVYSEVVRVVPPEYYARAQAVLQLGLMTAQTAGAIAAGYLYALSPALVFPSVGVVCLLSLLAVPALSRRGPADQSFSGPRK